MKPIIALTAAAAFVLFAAPMTFAQVDPPAAPPTVNQPADPADPANPANPATPPIVTPNAPPTGGPATPTAPPADPNAPPAASTAPPAPNSMAANTAAEAACRTRKDVGEQCSCLSAPTDFGTSQQAENGSHNMCMVPRG